MNKHQNKRSCKTHADTDELDFAGPQEMQTRLSSTATSWKTSPSLNHAYRPKGIPNIASPPHRKSSVNSCDSELLSLNAPGGTIEELNTTTMFSLNSDAKFNNDGSLKFAQNHHHPLPLTPIPKQRNREEVPPLDLSALRASTESTNSFKPYTGTSRSCDTIRHPFEQRPLPPLKTLPEAVPDSHGEELL